jgi:phosphoglycerate dehydrogenase-like enzyme
VASRVKILIPYGDEMAKALKDVIGNEAEVVQSDRSIESMLKMGGDADVIASGRVPSEYIRKATNLKMIQHFGAGVDKIDREAVLERSGLIVCNSHLNAAEVAEYAITLLFSLAKNIVVNDRALRKSDWSYGWGGPHANIELREKTALLVGLGNIGSEIADRLRPFGIQIIAATRSGKTRTPELVDRVCSIDNAESSIREADFVLLTLPLTPESQNLVDTEFISWMKPTSLLVNISRGPIVDEKALFEALREKRIQGAAIDVWWQYPSKWRGTGSPSEYPFHELDNVVMSPHRAAYSEEVMSGQVRFAGENILRFIRGQEPENIVDMKRGY